MTARDTSPARAPSAIRSPNSRVLRDTAQAITPLSPSVDIASVTIAKPRTNSIISRDRDVAASTAWRMVRPG
jgi:hypothetical protein